MACHRLVVGAIPELKTSGFKLPFFLANKTTRGAILVISLTSMAVIEATLLGLSQNAYLDGQVDDSWPLFEAGMTYFAASGLLFFIGFAFFFSHFRTASLIRMNAIRLSVDKKDKKEFVILELTLEKVFHAFVVMLILWPYFSVWCLTMAYYRNFFLDPSVSRAFLIITSISDLLILVLASNIVGV